MAAAGAPPLRCHLFSPWIHPGAVSRFVSPRTCKRRRLLVPWGGSPRLLCCSPPREAKRWESFRKKKVTMRVGYVGTDYKGLQKQRDVAAFPTIEAELETAIFKAGGILDSNYGKLHKVGWARSSRTDKGVHSLATMISLKMEIPEYAWKDDPSGMCLANIINSNLPSNFKIFSILPSQKYCCTATAHIVGTSFLLAVQHQFMTCAPVSCLLYMCGISDLFSESLDLGPMPPVATQPGHH